MAVLLVGFIVLLIYGLYSGDIYPKEGVLYVGIWISCLIVILVFKLLWALIAIPSVLFDALMIVKIFGGDVKR